MGCCGRWLRFVLAVPFIVPAGGNAQEPRLIQALALDNPLAIESVITQLATKRVVFVGETHSRYDHHLNQLEVIRRLRELDSNLVIGVEYFRQELQPRVDDYIARRTTEDEFLRAVDYYRTWGYDYRLYAPIFRFAREQKIPVRALNIASSLASAVAKVGIKGLSEQQRASLPRDIEPADEAYRSRLRNAFEGHGTAGPADFDHFVEAQLSWDESMANNAAEYLNANPGCRMVILAGAGHVAFGSGIPSRLQRRTHTSYAIVLSSGENIEPQIADYILLSKEEKLPPAGALGASLEEEGGLCRIRSLDPGGAAEKAGLKKGDVLVKVDGQPVKTTGDVRVALWDKKPGQHVVVEVRRGRWLTNTEHKFDVELTAPSKGVKP